MKRKIILSACTIGTAALICAASFLFTSLNTKPYSDNLTHDTLIENYKKEAEDNAKKQLEIENEMQKTIQKHETYELDIESKKAELENFEKTNQEYEKYQLMIEDKKTELEKEIQKTNQKHMELEQQVEDLIKTHY